MLSLFVLILEFDKFIFILYILFYSEFMTCVKYIIRAITCTYKCIKNLNTFKLKII